MDVTRHDTLGLLRQLHDRATTGATGQPGAAAQFAAEHSTAMVTRLYEMLLDELGDGGYSAGEVAMMRDADFYYGRFLNPRTRHYALHTLNRNLVRAVTHLGLPAGRPYRVLDIGCGLGMQSLLFALLGAEVVGLDLRPDCIALCRKRQAYYEARLGHPLALSFEAGDFLRRAQPSTPGFEGVFSMSAFIHILPTEATVAAIRKLLRPGGRVFIWDMNPVSFGRIRNAWAKQLSSPGTVRRLFEHHGFRVDLLTGGAAVPRQLWRWPLTDPLWEAVDALATRALPLSFNFILGATLSA